VDRAIARLVAYTDGLTDVPTLQALLQYAHRRFGVPGIAETRARYEHSASTPGERVFQRVVDRNWVATSGDLARLGDTDIMVSAALYCDVLPLPPAYLDTLETARNTGGYSLTHVLLSLELLRENHCTDVVPPGYEDSVAMEVAGLQTPSGPPTDLEIEVEAFLSLVGRADLMQPGFTGRLLEAQNADGGFSATGEKGAPSSWHSSGLALWALLSSRHPDAPCVPFVDPR
jgi:hypothetical protein